MSKLSTDERRFIEWARVAHLATVAPDGGPHVVPVCPALDGDRIVIATEDNAKVRNIRGNPRVAVVFDDYVEHWDHLRQVLVRGRAEIVTDGARWTRARDLLNDKFHQYEPLATIEEDTLMLSVSIETVVSEGLD
jgi:PPOX class probable F420-dependent enzyme